MRRAFTTIGIFAASLILIVNFRVREPEPSFEALAVLDEPIVVVTSPPTTARPATTEDPTTTEAPTTTSEFANSKWYATTTTRTIPPPRETGITTTTTTQAPLPTSPTARTFTGPVVETQFGDLQLEIIVAGDVIEDIIPIELPHRYHTSRSISKWSWKFCRTRTLEAQSSEFRIVSGATVTWRAYVESLEAAMEIAGLMPVSTVAP